MGQWEQAREVLLSASQERGGGRGGNIEVALDSITVSVTTLRTDCGEHQIDSGDKFTRSFLPSPNLMLQQEQKGEGDFSQSGTFPLP